MAEKIVSPGIFTNENDKSLVARGPQETAMALVGPTVKGLPLIPTYVTSYSEYESIFGSSFKSGSNFYEYFTSIAAREFFNNGGNTLLVTRVVSGSANLGTYASAIVPVSGSTVNASVSASFELESLTWGEIANNSGSILSSSALANGTSDNVRWEISNVDYTKGTFTLLIRRGDDNINQKNVLETWANLSLDPMASNFISRVIGDEKPVYVPAAGGDTAHILYTGSYANVSRYVRVKSVNTLHVNSLDNNGNFIASTYAPTLPNVGSGSIGGAFTGGVAATNLVQLMFEQISNSNVQGFTADDYERAFSLLENKDEYDFNLIIAPGVTLANAAADNMISICESRGDAMAIVDTQLFGGTVTGAVSAAASNNSNYAATYWPWLQAFSGNLGKSVWVPSSVLMGGVYAFNDSVGAEWFAPAGLNRGGIGGAIQAERKLTQSDRDTLYSANVNPLATFPGAGVVAYGQKTLQKRSTALDRVNVRRLLINLKKYLTQVGSTLLFEQNTIATRNKFLAQVNPYLESVVQRQGLYAFKVVMDDSNNTADVIDRNQLVGQIQIQPSKTIEFITLDFTILPTGVSFS